MARWYFLLIALSLLGSCKTGPSLLAKRTPYEQYAKKLTDAGLDATELGRLWISVGETALSQPQRVSLPYREAGYFPAESPRAMGLQFSVKRGQKLDFRLDRNPANGFQLYTELWRPAENGKPVLVEALEAGQTNFSYEADRDITFVLRLQPELLKSGDYTLSITVGPSLGFPVSGRSAKIGSFWGASRDEGARKHEGIDIFAPKGTPAIAAADGIVTSVREGGLGGKVVFMRPAGKDISLYYAHLDQQLVQERQRVSKGDTLGTVGNTGNAKTTPPHLHFGIYAFGGAIDPINFVNPDLKTPGELSFPATVLRAPMRLRSQQELRSANGSTTATYKANTLFHPWSVGSGSVIGRFPDGRTAALPQSAVTVANAELRSAQLREEVALQDAPFVNAPKKGLLVPEARVKVFGYFNEFAFVQTENRTGWVSTASLR